MEPVEPDLKVTDRRQFTADGVLKGDVAASRDSSPAAAPSTGMPPPSAGDAPPVTFPAFILSLASQAAEMIGGEDKDLFAARQVISAIEMLQDKTEGRRTADETKLVEAVLFDLRMAFVAASSGGRP